MHDCPCCGEAVYAGNDDDDTYELCSCCIQAGCEAHDCSETCGFAGEHDVDGVYDDCQIPRCPACDVPSTFTTNNRWSDNCDDDALLTTEDAACSSD